MESYVIKFCILAALGNVCSAQRIWSIAVGHEFGGHEYIDDSGYLKGFAIGLIDLVCSYGKLDCRIVRDKYENCWTHNEIGERPSGGRGLLSGWYDACTGWVPLVERLNTMDFSVPYTKKKPVYFFVVKGKENQFDVTDVSGKKFAFIKGFFANEQCLVRQDNVNGRILTKSQIKIVDTPSAVLQALESGQADVYFGQANTWTNEQSNKLYRFQTPEMFCTSGGGGLMARKDNGVISAWNVAFTKLKEANRFAQYCKEANAEHVNKGTTNCVD